MATLAACSDGGDDDQAASADGASTTTTIEAAEAWELEVLAADDSDFYDVPDPLPEGDHGDLVRVQPVDGAPEGVTWLRMMYLSETLAGEPTVVTGVGSLPAGEPPDGGWPLLTHAHGSTGLADPCAPSVSLTEDRTHAVEIVLLASHVAERGVAIVSTDYEGLGGPGRHPFLVGESEGRGVLDAALAAQQLPDVELRDEVGIIGYSQGGHAAAWANQIAPAWTPELDVVGVLAGAPATELDEMVSGDDGAGFLLVAALDATGEPFDADSALTDAGRRALEDVDRSCQGEYAMDGPLLDVDVSTEAPWAEAIAANVPGDEPGAAPVLVVHSREDLNVPVEGSAAFAERLCAAGQVVERRVLPSGDHATAAIEAYAQGIEWVAALAGGAEPASSCP